MKRNAECGQVPFSTQEIYIAGRWRPPTPAPTIALEDPSDGSELARIGRGGGADIDAAVAAARAALDDGDAGAWGRLSAVERGRVLAAIGRKVLDNVDMLAALEVHDVGKPLKQARADAVALARYCEFYAGACDKVHGQTLPFANGYTALTLREPHGVTGHIVPWNYPMQIVGRSVGAALAMGNACVLKPAEEACLTVLAFARICADAGLPAGALNVVTGLGEEAGAALAAHPGVDHLSFTGSVATGALVQIAAARNAVPVTLELGGKSPQIVFADADLEAALPFLVNAGIQNAGQTCSAASRILVERPVFARVRAMMAERYRALRAGPAARDLDLGPLISGRQKEGVEHFLALARDTGLAFAAEGEVVADAPKQRPLRAADARRRRPARPFARAGRDLRPRAGADRIRRRGRGDPHRQRNEVRPRRRRLDKGRQPRAANGARPEVRPGVRQQLRRRRRHRAAVRRRQALGRTAAKRASRRCTASRR